MGCDINLYIEYRHSGCPWQADHHHKRCNDAGNIKDIDSAYRCYELFGYLAGVRGYTRNFLEPRGLPNDISPVVKAAAEWWGDSCHTHSWVTLDEFIDIVVNKVKIKPNKTCNVFGEEAFNAGYFDIINYCNKIKKEQEELDSIIFGSNIKNNIDIRLVFWFNS